MLQELLSCLGGVCKIVWFSVPHVCMYITQILVLATNGFAHTQQQGNNVEHCELLVPIEHVGWAL